MQRAARERCRDGLLSRRAGRMLRRKVLPNRLKRSHNFSGDGDTDSTLLRLYLRLQPSCKRCLHTASSQETFQQFVASPHWRFCWLFVHGELSLKQEIVVVPTVTHCNLRCGDHITVGSGRKCPKTGTVTFSRPRMPCGGRSPQFWSALPVLESAHAAASRSNCSPR
jgi:hypothetical protein